MVPPSLASLDESERETDFGRMQLAELTLLVLWQLSLSSWKFVFISV